MHRPRLKPAKAGAQQPNKILMTIMQRIILIASVLTAVFNSVLFTTVKADDGHVLMSVSKGSLQLQVQGNKNDEWRFQASTNLIAWSNCYLLGTVYSSQSNPPSISENNIGTAPQFYRAVKTEGLFDPWVLRTISPHLRRIQLAKHPHSQLFHRFQSACQP